MISNETIQEAISRLVKAYNPLEIYMYGKYAWGTPDEDDDLSLLVVVESSDKNVYQRGALAFDTLLSLEIPKNVAIFTKQEFDTFSQDTTSLTYEVKNRGKQVYAKKSTSCKIVTGVTLILKKDNKCLLFKRNMPNKIAYGFFCLPGGTVEHDETVKQAACREAEEEIGITVVESDLSIVHMLRLREKYDSDTNQTQQILILYFAEVANWSGEPTNLEPHKHSDLSWFASNNLPTNTFALNLLALDEIKKGNFYSEHGWR